MGKCDALLYQVRLGNRHLLQGRVHVARVQAQLGGRCGRVPWHEATTACIANQGGICWWLQRKKTVRPLPPGAPLPPRRTLASDSASSGTVWKVSTP